MLRGIVNKVSARYGDVSIFNELSAEIPIGTKIAIVGPNGAGKTTLLSILAGEREPSFGGMDWIGRTPSISYYKQEAETEEPVDWTQSELLQNRSHWHVPKEVEYTHASGGERVKMRLTTTLAENREILLLDEPTNHLDAASVETLIQALQDREGTLLFVSHDRYFIDHLADLVFEIENGKLTVYEGNYTDYRKQKEHERIVHQKHYDEQQEHIAEIEGQIDRLDKWSAKGHAMSTKKGGRAMGAKEYYRKKVKKRNVQIKSKRTRLEAELKKSRVEMPIAETSVSFELEGLRKKGKRILELKDAGRAFGTNQVFKSASFTVQAGERLALLGPNGSGKTTLFRMLLGELDYDGDVWLSEGMTLGYLRQTAFDLPDELTMAEYFYSPSYEEQGFLRIQLTNLGFTAGQWQLPLGALSQGERLKVKLLDFIRRKTDVLLLDEPTNHLDLPSREELERTLETYPGTLLFASHDRYFTERMAGGLLLFENGTVRKVPYSLVEWEGREPSAPIPSSEQEKLRLETELQAVLGKLSLMTPGNPEYSKLDQLFFELSRQLRSLNS
ncbi:ABC transporter ATP-binding protein [Sporosarcina sp. BI001-red]|uniref:ribosomal protection-like ABC-F family protein n=1 Tax=Sporosarcina sp. BI001-red TaxID=2282866 RepID=UPI000E267711|nr:ABC-F family ATP-binding cassette domain-containing protein [Sporosarcina sp. BI001-red]REB08082.1 ABC transporter ATP-binding protein [Sporosarcina sp. BI001-red]